MTPKTASESSATPTGAASSTAARRVKGKRTRTGCLTCRARKVKCDEAPGTCGNCERVLLACRWPQVRNVLDDRATASSAAVKLEVPDGQASSIGPIRRNRQAACSACRIARCRCSQERPSCARCVEHGTSCEYTADRAQSHQQSGLTPSSAEASPTDEHDRYGNSLHGIPRATLDRHIDAFFTYVYPVQANAVVHRSTLMRDIADKKAAAKLVYAICAAANRFVESGVTPSSAPTTVPTIKGTPMANGWADKAKASLLSEDATPDSVAAALILAKHDIFAGRFSQAFILGGTATRMALQLKLHHEVEPDNPMSRTERETRRRLMWGCYSLDRMMSTGVPEYLATPAQHLKIRIPCDDQQYLFGIATNTPIPRIESEHPDEADPAQWEGVGIFGLHVRLYGIRTMILRVSRNRDPSDLPAWDPSSLFVAAERKLSAWKASLSPQFQFNADTIYARKSQNELSGLVMLHVWYHQNLAELTRLAMPGFNESLEPVVAATAPPGWIDATREMCVQSARSVAQTLKFVASLVDMDTVVFADSALPICVYECVRVRLQYAFLLPPAPQAAELAELSADTEVLFMFLDHMSLYLGNARWLLKETRRMLRRHGLDGGAHSDTSGAASPGGQDPWSRRVRGLRENGPRRPQLPHAYIQQEHAALNHQLGLPGLNSVPNGIQNGNNMGIPHQSGSGPGMLPSPQAPIMYQEPQSYSGWSNTPSMSGPDEVVAFLNQYSQSTGGSSGFVGTGSWGDWVAFGFDATLDGSQSLPV